MSLTQTATPAWSPAAASASPHAPASKFVVTTFNSKRFAGYQRIGYTMSRPGQNSTIGLTGYLHQIGGGFLIQAFKITQPDGFEFLNGQINFTGYWNAFGDKCG
jgi:hypothetical protein